MDEPTSSIDIFSQTQILKLLHELKDQFELTNILISHDLGVVNKMSDNIAVMYLGKIVEYGKADGVFSQPYHPYTKALFNSIPSLTINSVDELETVSYTHLFHRCGVFADILGGFALSVDIL